MENDSQGYFISSHPDINSMITSSDFSSIFLPHLFIDLLQPIFFSPFSSPKIDVISKKVPILILVDKFP